VGRKFSLFSFCHTGKQKEMDVSCHGPLQLSPSKPSVGWEGIFLLSEAGSYWTESEMLFDQYSL